MAAQRLGATLFDRRHRRPLVGGEARTGLLTVGGSIALEDRGEGSHSTPSSS